MPRDAVSRTAHVGTKLRKRNGVHKWVNLYPALLVKQRTNSLEQCSPLEIWESESIPIFNGASKQYLLNSYRSII